jgi:hypothetical protein
MGPPGIGIPNFAGEELIPDEGGSAAGILHQGVAAVAPLPAAR